jgi:GntR family transcriptional regulator, arabinose operon transcriptional repressor
MAKQRKTIPAVDAAAISTTISDVSRPESSRKMPKHQVVFDYLHGSIQSGVLKPGDRLPSEAELGKMFDASRITVAKAVLELQRMNLVTRRPGAGTHVQTRQQVDGPRYSSRSVTE